MHEEVTNVPNWAEIGSMIGTIITAGIAGGALFSWKDQKKYDIQIEALAKSRIAIDLISTLRSPFSHERELDENFKDEHLKSNNNVMTPIDYQYLLFQSRLYKHEKTYTDILTVREKLWAIFGEKNNLTKFYTEITAIVRRIQLAHLDRAGFTAMGLADSEEYKEKMMELHKITTFYADDDIISKDLEKRLDYIIKKK